MEMGMDKSYPVSINYGLSLAEMIAAGKYDRVDSGITVANFPVNEEGKTDVEVQLVHFGCEMTSGDVIHALGEQDLRPDTPVELLALGAKYPDVQRGVPDRGAQVCLAARREQLRARRLSRRGRPVADSRPFLVWVWVAQALPFSRRQQVASGSRNLGLWKVQTLCSLDPRPIRTVTREWADIFFAHPFLSSPRQQLYF